MSVRTCTTCVYSRCDAERWLTWAHSGQPLLVRCANHPLWPGELREVPGVACEHYQSRPVEPPGQVRHIPLGDGQYALVDAADYEWLSQYCWHSCSGGYAARSEKGKRILMHRQIMQPAEGMVVDHIDGRRANNCRSNLRVCTRAENQRNQRKKRGSSSKFKGVGYTSQSKRCYAKLVFEGKTVWLGHFDSEVGAARAYDRAAVEHQGEFAHLNFPDEWPDKRRERLRAEKGTGDLNSVNGA